jgi:plastocyanin domain-containing protein
LVVVDVPPQPAGRLAFACGMDMFKGQLVIK